MVGRINKSNSRARHWRQCANDDARDFSDPIDLADTRFARNVVALWKLGPRPVFELLSEIGGEFLIRVSVEKKVARFAARLTPDLLRAASADRMPTHQIRNEFGRITEQPKGM